MIERLKYKTEIKRLAFDRHKSRNLQFGLRMLTSSKILTTFKFPFPFLELTLWNLGLEIWTGTWACQKMSFLRIRVGKKKLKFKTLRIYCAQFSRSLNFIFVSFIRNILECDAEGKFAFNLV